MQGCVKSSASTLPVPVLHMHTVALPPTEELFAGQGTHIGSPGSEAGSMYSFTGQATCRRETVVVNEVRANKIHLLCIGESYHTAVNINHPNILSHPISGLQLSH